MVTLEDVRRIGLSLPETTADEDGVGVRNGEKVRGFAWRWKERVDPKKGRVPNPNVLAVRTPGLEEKELLIQSEPSKFFTEAHYNNYPAVLVRLAEIDADELEELLIDGWRCLAPKAVVKRFDASRP
jgi:hypothetical protein